jgi:hypothetical protein
MEKRGKNIGVPRTYKNKRLQGSLNLPPVVSFNKTENGGPPEEITEPRTSNQPPSKDLKDRITMGTWHPKEYTFAVARHNSLFIYTEKRGQSNAKDKQPEQH